MNLLVYLLRLHPSFYIFRLHRWQHFCPSTWSPFIWGTFFNHPFGVALIATPPNSSHHYPYSFQIWLESASSGFPFPISIPISSRVVPIATPPNSSRHCPQSFPCGQIWPAPSSCFLHSFLSYLRFSFIPCPYSKRDILYHSPSIFCDFYMQCWISSHIYWRRHPLLIWRASLTVPLGLSTLFWRFFSPWDLAYQSVLEHFKGTVFGKVGLTP